MVNISYATEQERKAIEIVKKYNKMDWEQYFFLENCLSPRDYSDNILKLYKNELLPEVFELNEIQVNKTRLVSDEAYIKTIGRESLSQNKIAILEAVKQAMEIIYQKDWNNTLLETQKNFLVKEIERLKIRIDSLLELESREKLMSYEVKKRALDNEELIRRKTLVSKVLGNEALEEPQKQIEEELYNKEVEEAETDDDEDSDDEEIETDDEEDSDDEEGQEEPEEETKKKKRGRPRKNPKPSVITD